MNIINEEVMLEDCVEGVECVLNRKLSDAEIEFVSFEVEEVIACMLEAQSYYLHDIARHIQEAGDLLGDENEI